MARSRKQIRPSPHLAQANERFARGDLAGAIRAAQEGLVSRKNDVQLLGILGGSQLAAGYIEAAIKTLSAVPIAGSSGRYCRTNLAGAFRALGRLEEAHRELDAVLSDRPGLPVRVVQKRRDPHPREPSRRGGSVALAAGRREDRRAPGYGGHVGPADAREGRAGTGHRYPPAGERGRYRGRTGQAVADVPARAVARKNHPVRRSIRSI